MYNIMDAENEFEQCWKNPLYTPIELDDVRPFNHEVQQWL